jgi:hypothetical protein
MSDRSPFRSLSVRARVLGVALAFVIAAPTFASPVAAEEVLAAPVLFPAVVPQGQWVRVLGSGCGGGEVDVRLAGVVTTVPVADSGLWDTGIATQTVERQPLPTGTYIVTTMCRTPDGTAVAYPPTILEVAPSAMRRSSSLGGGALAALLLAAGGAIAAAILAAREDDDFSFGDSPVVVLAPPQVTTTTALPVTTTAPPITTTTEPPTTTTTVAPTTTTTVAPTTTTTTTTPATTTTTSPYILASMHTASASVAAQVVTPTLAPLQGLALPAVQFLVGEEVQVTLARRDGTGQPLTLLSTTADPRGAVAMAFVIPAVATSGAYVLEVRGTTSAIGLAVPMDLRGSDVRAVPAELPRTGSSPLDLVAPALLLLAIGVLLLRRSAEG